MSAVVGPEEEVEIDSMTCLGEYNHFDTYLASADVITSIFDENANCSGIFSYTPYNVTHTIAIMKS